MVRDWQDNRLYRPENIKWNSWHLQVGEYTPGIGWNMSCIVGDFA